MVKKKQFTTTSLMLPNSYLIYLVQFLMMIIKWMIIVMLLNIMVILKTLVKEMITEEVIEGASMSRSYYDYADHTLVKKYLNDMIIDYI